MRGALFLALVALVILFALYWVIRLAVKHGIADADEERARIHRWAREISNEEQLSEP